MPSPPWDDWRRGYGSHQQDWYTHPQDDQLSFASPAALAALTGPLHIAPAKHQYPI